MCAAGYAKDDGADNEYDRAKYQTDDRANEARGTDTAFDALSKSLLATFGSADYTDDTDDQTDDTADKS